jgi:hypothetical protein
MKGDFSRLTFDPQKHFRGAYMQQGRVQLDSDWNEQIAIINHYLSAQLIDLFGPGATPQGMAGFQITMIDDDQAGANNGSEAANAEIQKRRHTPSSSESDQPARSSLDFLIGPGRYYVNGVMCENERERRFSAQPDYPQPSIPNLEYHCLAYLDVWERHITAFEDATLRESALGGSDTSTRVKIVWQVKLLPVGSRHLFQNGHIAPEDIVELPEWHELLHQHTRKGRLTTRHVKQSSPLDNLLYRVEIHQVHEKRATFKWSRDNGSIMFEIAHIQGYEKHNDGTATCVVLLRNLEQDTSRLWQGDWVEFVDEQDVLHNRTLPLYQIISLSGRGNERITLTGKHSEALALLTKEADVHVLLRRWDHNPALQEHGTQPVLEDAWIDLERGIQIRFTPGGTYDVGDYWLIPSRSLLDTIEWPSDKQGPLALPPRTNHHHYCPLALLHFHQNAWTVASDLRRSFTPLPVLTERMKNPLIIEETEIIEEVSKKNALYEECLSIDVLERGDLVSLIPGSNLQVIKANRSNAKLVFGIVSGESTENGQKRFRITTYGRAYCKVADSVEAGDLLTPSEVDGCATKTNPLHEFFQPGTLVGKALVSFVSDGSDDPGIIEMFVTLQ